MFSLDSRSREPIYVQLEKEIVKYINLGVYEADSPLPSVRALAKELSIKEISFLISSSLIHSTISFPSPLLNSLFFISPIT